MARPALISQAEHGALIEIKPLPRKIAFASSAAVQYAVPMSFCGPSLFVVGHAFSGGAHFGFSFGGVRYVVHTNLMP